MKIPTPDMLAKILEVCQGAAPQPTAFEPFSETKAKIAKYAKAAFIAGAQSGLQTAVTAGSGVATLSVPVGMASLALFPLGAALAPWLTAAAIASKAESIFALHDLRSSAKAGGGFKCSCGNCVANLTYVIDRKENNVAVLAVGVFTAGLAIIADRLNSVRKSFEKNRPKERICTSIVTGARGGCVCAIGTVLMIREEKDAIVDAIAVIWSTDGALRLKSKW
jgi:hypothetical protein